MGIFNRKKAEPETYVLQWDGSYAYSIVGESFHRDELVRIIGEAPAEWGESGSVYAIATLRRDPHNVYDPNAVAVSINNHTVGHIARDDAVAAGILVAKVEASNGTCASQAQIGWSGPLDSALIGARLDMPDITNGFDNLTLTPISELGPDPTDAAHRRPRSPILATTEQAAGTLRGTTFGDTWVEVVSGGSDRKALGRVVSQRGSTGPRSLRVDDVSLAVNGATVAVLLGSDRVGVLPSETAAGYLPVLESVGMPVVTSGIVLIDAEGHPGNHLKLYAPGPGYLVPVNALDPAVPVLPAHDRAAGLTLARNKAGHLLVEQATASWWTGDARSVWVIVTKTPDNLSATLDGHPLPEMDPARFEGLARVWEQIRPTDSQLQLEASVHAIKAGRQLTLRYPFAS